MNKITWKDKLWWMMEGFGFVFLYLGLPLVIGMIILDLVFLGQTGFIMETINNLMK